MSRIILILSLLSFPFFAFGQTKTDSLRGKVLDEEGQVMPFSRIEILKNNKIQYSTKSDLNGDFSIPKLNCKRCTLKVSSVGYYPLIVSSRYLSNTFEIFLRKKVLKCDHYVTIKTSLDCFGRKNTIISKDNLILSQTVEEKLDPLKPNQQFITKDELQEMGR